MRLDAPARKIVELMQESSKRMTDLTVDILDFARGKLGGGVPLRSKEEDELGPILTHVIDELRAVHPEREIELEIDLGGAVYCDAARLAQLLSNLVGNALTHGSKLEPVRVSINDVGRELRIVVSNGGEKIPARTLVNLFHPFARGSGAQDGIGLGLYIASEVAKAHGGTLTATSTEDQTVFSACLPATKDRAGVAA
jgi:signal transduction histidine kinase